MARKNPEEREKHRTIVGGMSVGCPVAYGQGPCVPVCGGGWKGTDIASERIVEIAKRESFKPKNMPCGSLVSQAQFLVKYFAEQADVS